MKRKLTIAIIGFGLAALAVVPLLRRPPHITVLLTDGSRVQLHSITRGTNHAAVIATIPERILNQFPKAWIPPAWMKSIRRNEITTSTNAIVVWLHLTGRNGQFRYGVTDTNGFGAFASALGNLRQNDGLNPVILEEWPRSHEQIAISLFDDDPAKTPLGRIIFKNPSRVSASRFEARHIPAIATNELRNLHLILSALDVLPDGQTFPTRVGSHWACRARFQMSEAGVTNQDWMVQSMFLSDPHGNRRRATGPREWVGDYFEIFTAPLWFEDSAWRIDVDLTRRTNFPGHEIVTFTNVPIPNAAGPEQISHTKNFLGHQVTLRSMRTAQAPSKTHGMHSLGGPGFAIQLNPPETTFVPRIVALYDENHQELRVPGHGYGDGYSLARFPPPNSPPISGPLTVQVTVQRRHTFTFFAEPNVLRKP